MIIKRGYFVALLVGAVFFSSCDPDSDGESGKYYGNSFSPQQTSLYVKGGEVKDRSVIDRFVKLHGNFEPNWEMILSAYRCQATYLDSSTVVVKSLAVNSTDTMRVLKRDGLIIWERRDTVHQYAKQMDAFKYRRIHYTEEQVDGVTLITNFLDCTFLERSGRDLLMPITFYYHKKGSNGSVSERHGKGNNEFNPDYILSFGNTDTVLVYRYTLRLRAQ